MSEQWYVRVRGREKGPFSAEQLRSLVQQRALLPQHHLRQGIRGRWVAAGRIQGLFPSTHLPAQAVHARPAPAAPLGSDTDNQSALPAAEPDELAGLAAASADNTPAAAHAERKGSNENQRLVGFLVPAFAFGISGLFLYAFPILPLVFGAAATFFALRSLPAALRGHVAGKTAATLATIVGLIACVAGTATTLMHEKPLAKLREMLPLGEFRQTEVEDYVLDARTESAIERGVHVSISMVTLESLSEDGATASSGTERNRQKFLVVELRLENHGEEWSVPYRSWSSAVVKNADGPRLYDDLGQEIAPVIFRGGRIPGQIGDTTIHERQIVKDLLIFQRPQSDYRHLLLTMPASALDGAGEISFRIPRDMVVELKPPELPPEHERAKIAGQSADPSISKGRSNPLETVEITKEPDDESIKGQAREIAPKVEEARAPAALSSPAAKEQSAPAEPPVAAEATRKPQP